MPNSAKHCKLLATLRRDLAHKRHGTPLRWKTTPYTMFRAVTSATNSGKYRPLLNEFKRASIEAYYNRFVDNKDRIAAIEKNLARANHPRPVYAFSPDHKRSLQELAADLRAQNDDIKRTALTCFNTNSPCPTALVARLDRDISLIPDEDMSGIEGWTVRMAPRPGRDMAVDFWAQPDPPNACKPRLFETHKTFSSPFSGVTHVCTQDGWRGPVPLGTSDLVHNQTGKTQPNICFGSYANFCAWRIIRLPNSLGPDGCPHALIELVIFNTDGTIAESSDFNSYILPN